MANRRDIKRRISSVINTQKITRAMKLVAAAKFARAAQAVNAAKPYSKALFEVCQSLMSKGESKYSQKRCDNNSALVVLVATDRGLCGGLNSNLFKKCALWLKENNFASVKGISIGRKAKLWFRQKNIETVNHYEKMLDKPSLVDARMLCEELIKEFENYSYIYLVSNEFQNALTQVPKVELFLPFEAQTTNMNLSSGGLATGDDEVNYIAEPSFDKMQDALVERLLRTRIFQCFLESAASEHGSRMTAMDSATTNANEVRKKLTLKYNRVRQAAITKELIEIVSGAEALS